MRLLYSYVIDEPLRWLEATAGSVRGHVPYTPAPGIWWGIRSKSGWTGSKLSAHHKFHSVEIYVPYRISHKYDELTLMNCQLCPIHIIMDIPGHCSTLEIFECQWTNLTRNGLGGWIFNLALSISIRATGFHRPLYSDVRTSGYLNQHRISSIKYFFVLHIGARRKSKWAPNFSGT